MSRLEPLIKLSRVLRAGWHWRARRSLVVPTLPLIISLEVTNRCNFACAFCPQSDPEHAARSPRGALSPERARVLLRRVREAGWRAEEMSWTLDGEPFMNPRFGEIIAEAAAQGFTRHNLASNGALMTPQRLRALPRGCRYTLLVDLCASEARFEAIRGTPGSWRRVLDNLSALLEAPDLAHIEVHVGEIASDDAPRGLAALLPPSPRLRIYPVGPHHNAAGTLGPGVFGGPRYSLCPYPWTTMYVAWTGEVVACCRDLQRQTVLGNLFERPLLEIWNGEAARALRRDLRAGRPARQAACRGCSLPWSEPQKFTLRNLINTARVRLGLSRGAPRREDHS